MERTFWHHSKMVTALIALSFFLATQSVGAATRPDSGAVLDNVKQQVGQQSAGPKESTIKIEDNEPSAVADNQQKILVQGFRIVGEPPVPADELLNLIKGEAGKEMTLSEMKTLTGKLSQHMRQNGYPVAFAYIPAQDLKDGILNIAVIPGKYGQLKITGSGHFDHGKLKNMMCFAKQGTVITQGPLERGLLILSNLNSVSVKTTLTPGAVVGTADIILEVTDTAKWRGVTYVDNWGNRYTSRNRLGVQLMAGNIGGWGDDLSIGGLVSENSRLSDCSFGYSLPWGGDGARVSINYSNVDYTLGESYADLGATGQATVMSTNVSYPLIRSRAFSLYGSVAYVDKRLRDDISATASYSPKKSHMVNIGLAGDFGDNWLGGGVNDFSITYYKGKLNILDATTASIDDATAKTGGDFSKTVFGYQRQQYMADSLIFYVSFTGQVADRNLDSSEKLFLGGADGVRAFPQGEASGDNGYKLTGELRWRLKSLSTDRDNVYLAGFYDYGSVIVNHNPWTGAGGSNRRSLMGAGLGLGWTRSSDFSLRLDCAWKIGKEQAMADTDKNGRLWLQAIKYF